MKIKFIPVEQYTKKIVQLGDKVVFKNFIIQTHLYVGFYYRDVLYLIDAFKPLIRKQLS